jgi:hypothetical protein
MDNEIETLRQLRETVRSGRQHSQKLHTIYEATMPQIKMIVSNWLTDELGNRARIIQASD